MKAHPLQRRFTDELDEVEWSALEDHHARGALFEVAPDLPLVKVAMAVALDLVDDVRGWLDAGDLRQVTDERAAALRVQSGLQLTFLIVQPYVLISETTGADSED